jgi:hypothetical protein
MVRRRSLANRAELSRNHLCLPFRIKRDAEDGFALITQELQYGHRSLGSFIASSQGFDDNVGSSFALRTPADHTWLLFGMLEDIVGSGTARSRTAHTSSKHVIDETATLSTSSTKGS